MIRTCFPLLAVAGLANPAAAAEVQIQANGPVIELSVTETVDARPDIATVSAGVTTDAQTAVEAMRANARQMSAVVERIKALGIEEDEIQTTGINLNPRYDYDRNTQQQVFRGYQASNRVSVKLREIDETGEVLDALVAAGATDIGGPAFSIDDDAAYRAEARRAAMERARTQAQDYATMTGHTGLKLLEINESISGHQPMPVAFRVAADAAQEASTPVQPGLVGTSINVTVKYELTR
jgi:hypothetical protein